MLRARDASGNPFARSSKRLQRAARPAGGAITLNNSEVRYTYDALGNKLRKLVSVNNGGSTTTTYLDGFQYENDQLQFFPHPEGYVRATHSGSETSYSFVYQYKDHLGNIRMNYAFDKSDRQVKILKENHYYPFGLIHKNYNSERRDFERVPEQQQLRIAPVAGTEAYKYKYNGKEWQDELGLGLYDYGAMLYDPAIGRRNNIDPLAEKSRRFSPYSYALNNPIFFIDPDGMRAVANEWYPDENGNLHAEKGDTPETLANYLGVSVDEAAKYKSVENGQVTNNEMGKDHEYKEGDVVLMNNRMTRSVANSEETDGSFNCYGSVRTYVATNKELTGENSNNAGGLFEDYGGGTGAKQIDNTVKSSLTKIDSFDKAKFGETVILFKGQHAAIYYGTDNKGNHYFYSKNGWDKPEFTTLKTMQNMAGTTSYELYNIKK